VAEACGESLAAVLVMVSVMTAHGDLAMGSHLQHR